MRPLPWSANPSSVSWARNPACSVCRRAAKSTSAVSAVGASFGMASCYAVPPPRGSRPRVGALVGTAQVLGRDLGVALGRGDGRMAQELLDDPHVGPSAQHVGGAGVAQDVRADLVGQADAAGVLLDDAEDPDAGQPTATGVEEDGLGVAAPPPLLR